MRLALSTVLLGLSCTLAQGVRSAPRECSALPTDTFSPLSERALELHCELAGKACTVDPGRPQAGVVECGGLACVVADATTSATAGVCRLPRTAADCPDPADLERGGGYCSMAGKRCQLVERMPAAATGSPDDVPEEPPAASYQPTPATVFDVCGGLGCVDDPASDEPTEGICALAQTPDACGGAANPGLYDGRCGPRHIHVKAPEPMVPMRSLATGGYVIDLGNDTRGGDVVPGGIFQVGLTRSRVRKLDDGSYQHFGLPSFYLHTALLVSRRRLAPEVGLVYKTGCELFTRLGVAAYGQLWSADDILSSSSFGVGPSLHVELFYNLLLRGAYVFGDDTSPQATFGIQYAASLFDDFK